jgi:uncharacterized cupredoxin-like copper-binding protein
MIGPLPPTPSTGRVRASRRPGPLALVGGVALSLVMAGVAGAWVQLSARPDAAVTIEIRYSHYEPSAVTVPLGVPITFTIHNGDPIDHEWIVGDAAVHERHRTGTELVHGARPTEITIPAGQTRTTTVVFAAAGSQQYICHLPGHEAYGMVGTVTIDAG